MRITNREPNLGHANMQLRRGEQDSRGNEVEEHTGEEGEDKCAEVNVGSTV